MATVEAIRRSEAVMTAEQLAALGDVGPCELVRGRLIRMSPTGHLHGFIERNFCAALSAIVHPRGGEPLGRVLVGEVGIYTSRNPDTVRGADVAYVSNQRLARVRSQSYLDVAPELVVEIVSPDDRWTAIVEKLDEYFAIDVELVWLADPRRQIVLAYRSTTEVEELGADDYLTGGDVLPGFRVRVRELLGA
ncbi:MAG: Uma2 family endonuclease [Acidobacteria bacterium]|nr:MAG: Uma2 family endonuclease [Acidobacteriota bacterium]